MYFTLALDIKGINIIFFKSKLNIKNILLIFLMFNFLIIDNANSAPPPLPPALPKQEDNKINNNEESKKESLFFDRIFGSEKSDHNALEKPVQQTIPVTEKESSSNAENADGFINLGDKKLPILENSETESIVNSVPTQGQINQQNDNQDIVIPSLPPEVQNDLNPYVKPIKSDAISPAAPSLQNEVGNDNKGNVIPVLPPVLPLNKAKVPQVDTAGIKKEGTAPISDTTTANQQTPVLVLPPVSVPEVEVTKPLLDKKDNNKNILPLLPTEKVTPSTYKESKNNVKTETTEQNDSSPKKLLLDNSKIPTKVKGQTPIPVFVEDNKPVIEEKKNDKEKSEKKVEEQEKNKKKTPEPAIVTTIPKPVVEKNIPEKEISEELTQFINNETQMLLLPNDDIVLGELTDDARIEQMEMYKFVNIFKQIYDRDKRKGQKQQIDNFIKNYSSNFRTIYIMPCNVMMAFDTITKNDLSSLRGLLDNYPILQRKGEGGNTLLHVAVEQNNYYIVKFLIIRGININSLNDDCKKALDIALEQCNGNIACLIMRKKNIVK
ncbi:MAG: ankyrin repeat domain-containing protein [Candidatus Rickettsia vulgarisii]